MDDSDDVDDRSDVDDRDDAGGAPMGPPDDDFGAGEPPAGLPDGDDDFDADASMARWVADLEAGRERIRSRGRPGARRSR